MTDTPAATDVRLKNAHGGADTDAPFPTVTIALEDQHGTRRDSRGTTLVLVTMAVSDQGYWPPIVTTFPSTRVEVEGEYPEMTIVVAPPGSTDRRCTAESTNFGQPVRPLLLLLAIIYGKLFYSMFCRPIFIYLSIFRVVRTVFEWIPQ